MTNPHFTKIEQYRDVESLNYYRILREQDKTEAETLDIICLLYTSPSPRDTR